MVEDFYAIPMADWLYLKGKETSSSVQESLTVWNKARITDAGGCGGGGVILGDCISEGWLQALEKDISEL